VTKHRVIVLSTGRTIQRGPDGSASYPLPLVWSGSVSKGRHMSEHARLQRKESLTKLADDCEAELQWLLNIDPSEPANPHHQIATIRAHVLPLVDRAVRLAETEPPVLPNDVHSLSMPRDSALTTAIALVKRSKAWATNEANAASASDDHAGIAVPPQNQNPITLGWLINELESDEKAKEWMAEEYKREEAKYGTIGADGWLNRQRAFGLFHPDPAMMPGIDRIEHLCDAEFHGSGLTIANVRQLRVMICKKLKWNSEQARCADGLSLIEAADVLEGVHRIPFDVIRGANLASPVRASEPNSRRETIGPVPPTDVPLDPNTIAVGKAMIASVGALAGINTTMRMEFIDAVAKHTDASALIPSGRTIATVPSKITEELDRYLVEADRMTVGTAGSATSPPAPLPRLEAGVPLYDLTSAWIGGEFGGRDKMPPDGLRRWDKLLRASRFERDNIADALKAWAQWLLELRARQWAPNDAPVPIPSTTPSSGANSPKEPSKDAFAVYRYQIATGKNQTELAADPMLMAQLGKTVVQGTISRWLKNVRKWLKAGNVLPEMPGRSDAKPVPMDPERIDMGPRQDYRTPRQRQRGDSDHD
jgi:hypothetical protein